MALPTITKTWQYSRNNTVAAQGTFTATNKRLLRSVISTWFSFGSNPPTCRYSCNSVTAGTAGDGVNRWSTDGDIVGNSPGSAHSWMVLQIGGIASSFQVVFDCVASTAQLLTIAISPSAGFTGGTTTARPTATDEMVVVSSSSWGGVGSDAQIRYSWAQSTDGQCNRLILGSAGVTTGIWLFEKPANPTSGWSNPHVVLINTGSSNTVSSLNTVSRARIGTVNSTIQLLSEGSTSGMGVADATWGNVANDVDGTWPIFPVSFASVTAGSKGRHGTFQDLWVGSSAVATADGYPNDGTNSLVHVGNLVLPWGGDSTALALT